MFFFVLEQQHSLFADVGFRSNDVNVTKVASFFFFTSKIDIRIEKQA